MPTTSPSSNGSDSNIGGGGGGGVGSGEPSRWHGAIATGGADDCIRIFRDRGSLRDPASVAASVAASGSVSESASASAFAHAPASEDSMCNCCSGDEGGDSCRSGVVAMSTSEGEEGQEEELHYVQGKLPCGVWATWSGRTSKHALVGRDGNVSLAWKDGYQGTRLKAKGRVVAVAETLAPCEPCVVWEVTLRGDCKTFWFRDPESALPGGFLTREEEQAMQKAYDVTRPRHAPPAQAPP